MSDPFAYPPGDGYWSGRTSAWPLRESASGRRRGRRFRPRGGRAAASLEECLARLDVPSGWRRTGGEDLPSSTVDCAVAQFVRERDGATVTVWRAPAGFEMLSGSETALGVRYDGLAALSPSVDEVACSGPVSVVDAVRGLLALS